MSTAAPVSLAMRAMLSTLAPAGRGARLSIFIFHRVLPKTDPLFPDEVDAQRFDDVLGWIGRWFNVLPLAAAAKRLRDGTLPARPACITFDDGYADNYTVALPLLAKHGLHATFFIATGFLDGKRMWNDTLIEAVRSTPHAVLDLAQIGLGELPVASLEDKRRALSVLIPDLKYREPEARAEAVAYVAECCGAALPDDLMLTSQQLRALHQSGMGIGAHTAHHPILARCSDEQARDEIVASRDALEALLGDRITLFAYPNGKLGTDYLAHHAALVRDLGFDAAVSTNPGASRHGDDVFQLRRFTPWDRTPLKFGLRSARNALLGATQ